MTGQMRIFSSLSEKNEALKVTMRLYHDRIFIFLRKIGIVIRDRKLTNR